MEKPKFVKRILESPYLRGFASIGEGMTSIGEGMSRISLSQTVEHPYSHIDTSDDRAVARADAAALAHDWAVAANDFNGIIPKEEQ